MCTNKNIINLNISKLFHYNVIFEAVAGNSRLGIADIAENFEDNSAIYREI